jgi:tripartite ATP-independent transporter DctM subunit
MLTHGLFYGVNSFVLLSVPFFILMGEVMNQGGITRRIFRFARALVGHLPGGLGHVNIIASIIFAGMSGAAVADVGGLGTIEIKAMVEDGYDREFSAGITSASATIGPIIPPSIPIVIYGVYSNVSVAELFAAGLLPGIVIGISLTIYVFIVAKRRSYPVHKRASLNEFLVSFRKAFLSLMAPIILVGGIIFGVFTPTECGATAAAYALFLAMVVYREIKLSDLPSIMLKVARTTSFVMLLVSVAAVLSWILARERVPVLITEEVLGITSNPITVLAIINALLLGVGCFMGPIPSIMILFPVLQPVLACLGINLVQFGIIMVFNLVIGLLTPPMASVLYIVSNIAEVPFAKMCRVIVPFYIPLIIALAVITYTPVTLFLPNLLFR